MAELKADGPARRPLMLRPRPTWCAVAGLTALCSLATLGARPRPLLVWNASPSSPVGLYALGPAGRPRPGEIIVAWAPRAARRLADARQYLPLSAPLVKQVGAGAGDRVCAKGATIFVNGRVAALRAPRDPSGRAMPWWSGCRRLRAGEAFLLSGKGPLAFDGRYFGVSKRSEIVGKAKLLWPG